MSEEAFHIMTQMDLEGAETQAVLQCAPLLTGIKMSNLLHVREGQQREVASMFVPSACAIVSMISRLVR